MSGLKGWFVENRRRLAKFVAVAGVMVLALQLFEAFPRDIELRYRLDQAVTEARIDYAHAGEHVSGVTVSGPAAEFDHSVSLSPGRYVIEATLRQEDGSTRVETRTLDVPVEGTVWVDLRGSQVLEGG